MTDRDRQRLVGVHPKLIADLEVVFADAEVDGTPMFVVVGVRTAYEQGVLWAQGRTTKGPIVTNCNGVKFKSPHQVRADGFGYAVDCAFISAQPFDPRHPWEAYGERLEELGLVWGGRFHHPIDLDHAELPEPIGVKA